MPTVLLAYYCALILVASIAGGMIPVWFQLTHRWMQIAVSFVAGVMLGIGVLHMLPHAFTEAAAAANALASNSGAIGSSPPSVLQVTAETARWISLSLVAGMLAMFFIERFFSYHHHEVPEGMTDEESHGDHQHDCNRPHQEHHGHQPHACDRHHSLGDSRGNQTVEIQTPHNLSWSGAAAGLALHSVLNGVALAAAVQHGSHGSWLAGFGTFLVIFLHKPFDAMTISMLMGRGGWSFAWRHTINGLFACAIPLGVVVFYLGLSTELNAPASAARQWYIACALAFSAGTFLCISLSDLLPELQFHRHDRLKLSAALLLGMGVAHVAAQLEQLAHAPHPPATALPRMAEHLAAPAQPLR